jgi:hypothetical protein
MPPEPAHPFDPEDIPYFFDNWCSLPWSPWVPFSATKEEFRQIPHEPGLYRIRPAGKDFLMYIGETQRSLHQRLHNLRMDLRNPDLMPWSDPHTEAPGLWAGQDDAGFEAAASPGPEEGLSEPGAGKEPVRALRFECSATPLDASTGGRKGMENFLLYKYRQERGESTPCNFGRFHPRYRKSTIRKEGLRGGRLAEGQKDNPAGWPGIGPLEVVGKPGDSDWMGLEWTALKPLAADDTREVPAGAGLYVLADALSHEIVYIGQSADVARRLLDNSHTTGEDKSLAFSYQIIGQAVLQHNLRELATDLIGNYYENYRKAPELQFRGKTDHETGGGDC